MKAFGIGIIGMFLLLAVGLVGWILNIISIADAGTPSEWTGFIIVRAIGIVVAPLGAVLGFF